MKSVASKNKVAKLNALIDTDINVPMKIMILMTIKVRRSLIYRLIYKLLKRMLPSKNKLSRFPFWTGILTFLGRVWLIIKQTSREKIPL